MSDPVIFDGHNDVLLHLADPEEPRDFFVENEKGHLDLPRARAGNFGGGFFAIWIPPTPPQRAKIKAWREKNPDAPLPLPEAVPTDYALLTAMQLSSVLVRLEQQSEGAIKIVRDVETLVQCLQDQTLAAIWHMEGAEAIDTDLYALDVFYQAGLRSLGLVWSRPNQFAEGVPFVFNTSPDTGPGLTAAGKKLVQACNRLGIMLDLSHLNAKGFWDVAKLSNAPLVATHSNAFALSPIPRNLTDEQLDAVAESGGVVGLNFGTMFLRADGKSNPDTPLETMVAHIDYMVERMGVEHVALGSDFDGTRVPAALKDVTGLPKLIAALRTAGYNDEALRKIAHENWVRVLRQTWH